MPTFHIENHSLTKESVLSIHFTKSEDDFQLDIFTSRALLLNCKVQSNAITSKKYFISIGDGFLCSIALPNNSYIISKSETKRKHWIPIDEFELRNSYWVEKHDAQISMRKLNIPDKERHEYITHAQEITLNIPKQGKKIKQRKYIIMASNIGKLYSMRRKGQNQISLIRTFDDKILGLFFWLNEYYMYSWIYCSNGNLYEIRTYLSNVIAAAKRCSSNSTSGRKWDHPFRFISNANLSGFLVFNAFQQIELKENINLNSEDKKHLKNSKNEIEDFKNIDMIQDPITDIQKQPLKFIFDPEEEIIDSNCPPCAWALQVGSSKLFHGPIIISDLVSNTNLNSLNVDSLYNVPLCSISKFQILNFENSPIIGENSIFELIDFTMTPHHFIISRKELKEIYIQVLNIVPRIVKFTKNRFEGTNFKNNNQISNSICTREVYVKKKDIILNIPVHMKHLNGFCHSGHFALLNDGEWNQIFVSGVNNILEIKVSSNEHEKVSIVYCRRALDTLRNNNYTIEEKKNEGDYYFKLAYRCAISDHIKQYILRRMSQFYFKINNYKDAAILLAGTDLTIEEVSQLFLQSYDNKDINMEFDDNLDLYNKLKLNCIIGLRNYLMLKTSFKENCFKLLEFPIQTLNTMDYKQMTDIVLWILDLYLFEEHLEKNELEDENNVNMKRSNEFIEFVNLLNKIKPGSFDALMCFYLLMNKGYKNEALMIANQHELSEQLIEYYTTESFKVDEESEIKINSEIFFKNLHNIDQKRLRNDKYKAQMNKQKGKNINKNEDLRQIDKPSISSLNLVKQTFKHDPVKAIQWLEYSLEHSNTVLDSNRHQISDLISLCPIMWSNDSLGIKERSKEVLLPYFQVWSQSGNISNSSENLRFSKSSGRFGTFIPGTHNNQIPNYASTPTTILPSNEAITHSCGAALVCIHEMLSRKTPNDIIMFMPNLICCKHCMLYILRKVTSLRANFTDLSILENQEIETELKIQSNNEEKAKLYIQVNCKHVAALCHLHLQQHKHAIFHYISAASNLYHFETDTNNEANQIRKYFLSMARKIANYNISNDDTLSTEVEEQREELWNYLIETFCELYQLESSEKSLSVKQEQYSSDLSSFLFESQKSTTPIRASAKIISLIPSSTLVSSFKNNIIDYSQKVCKEMDEIKEDAESHTNLLKELKHMSFSNNHYKQELMSNCVCSSPMCKHSTPLTQKYKPLDNNDQEFNLDDIDSTQESIVSPNQKKITSDQVLKENTNSLSIGLSLKGITSNGLFTKVNSTISKSNNGDKNDKLSYRLLQMSETVKYDENSFVYSFSCGHHFHSPCIEELILSFPSHEEILNLVEEKGMDIRLFPMRHAITKLTLLQLNRRNLFFERAAEYARSQSQSKNSTKQFYSIFKRCLKQLAIASKKHELFRHECPLCNGMFTTTTILPFSNDSYWNIHSD